MSKKHAELNILLLQIRDDDITALEEYYQFTQLSQLQGKQIDVLNTCQTPHFQPDVINGYDALFVGGSSDASVLNAETFSSVACCRQLVRRCYEENIPVFASCFGFQVAIQEFGGHIILDKENMEIGLYHIQLTAQAKTDILLHDSPNAMWASKWSPGTCHQTTQA